MEKAEDRVARGDYQEALEDYETVLHMDRGHLPALLKKADLLDRLRRPAEALEALEQVLARDPWNHGALFQKGALLEREGRHDEALGCYDRILQGGPIYLQALVRKGDILTSLGEGELAWEAYTEALRLSPDDAPLREKVEALEVEREDALDRARRERQAGNPTDAEAWYLRALEGEGRPEALRELLEIYLEGGRREEAIPLLDEAILEAPRDADLLLRRAEALAELGRLADALDACEGVVELDAERPEVWALKGGLEARLDLRDRALESLERALTLNPRDPPTAALREELLARRREEEELTATLQTVEGIPEEAVAAVVEAYGSQARLRKAKVRNLVEFPEVTEDLAKRVLRRVRRGR
jgi:tetratricopeptide (TPR) repeat protein